MALITNIHSYKAKSHLNRRLGDKYCQYSIVNKYNSTNKYNSINRGLSGKCHPPGIFGTSIALNKK